MDGRVGGWVDGWMDVLQIFKINPSKGRISGPRVVKEKGMKWGLTEFGKVQQGLLT